MLIARGLQPAIAVAVVVTLAASCGDDGVPDEIAQLPDAADLELQISDESIDESGIDSSDPTEPAEGASGEHGIGLPALSGTDTVAWTVEIIDSIPHDVGAWTQGLAVGDDGTLYESTGRYGQSSLRVLDQTTGEVITLVALGEGLYGEGITIVDDRIIQITWQNGVAIVYDRSDLVAIATFEYRGEGWGLCALGPDLVMTDGSNQLIIRDAVSFEELDRIDVYTTNGLQTEELNELECVGQVVIANVLGEGFLHVIDPVSGQVIASIDAFPLLDDVVGAGAGDELGPLNGVAAVGDGTFWMTGKYWPLMYRVEVVPA